MSVRLQSKLCDLKQINLGLEKDIVKYKSDYDLVLSSVQKQIENLKKELSKTHKRVAFDVIGGGGLVGKVYRWVPKNLVPKGDEDFPNRYLISILKRNGDWIYIGYHNRSEMVYVSPSSPLPDHIKKEDIQQISLELRENINKVKKWAEKTLDEHEHIYTKYKKLEMDLFHVRTEIYDVSRILKTRRVSKL